MVKINWAEVIHDTLLDTYVNQRGEKPEGSFAPSEELIADLLKHFKDRPSEEIVDFLKNSMYAHMSKTQRTRAPFFVKDLLAPKNLKYLQEKGDALRDHYTMCVEPLQFNRMIYGAVYGTELDYLDVMGGLWMKGRKSFMWDLLSPNPYWLIFSEYWGRFTKDTVDQWDSVTVEYGGKHVNVLQARARERTKLGQDTARWENAKMAAASAIKEAAMDWASRLGFIRVMADSSLKMIALPDSAMPLDLLDVRKPLIDRDKSMFNWARECVEHRALDTGAPGHAVAARVLEPVEAREPHVLHKLTPELAVKAHDDHADA